jgi:hypothetical protein
MLALAERRMPVDQRDSLMADWIGELHQILRGAEARPVLRLARGTRFAFGFVCSGPAIGRILDGVRGIRGIPTGSGDLEIVVGPVEVGVSTGPVEVQLAEPAPILLIADSNTETWITSSTFRPGQARMRASGRSGTARRRGGARTRGMPRTNRRQTGEG